MDYKLVNRMVYVCLTSLAILAGGLTALYTLSWYKGRGPRDRKRVKKEEEPKEAPLEQLT